MSQSCFTPFVCLMKRKNKVLFVRQSGHFLFLVSRTLLTLKWKVLNIKKINYVIWFHRMGSSRVRKVPHYKSPAHLIWYVLDEEIDNFPKWLFEHILGKNFLRKKIRWKSHHYFGSSTLCLTPKGDPIRLSKTKKPVQKCCHF